MNEAENAMIGTVYLLPDPVLEMDKLSTDHAGCIPRLGRSHACHQKRLTGSDSALTNTCGRLSNVAGVADVG